MFCDHINFFGTWVLTYSDTNVPGVFQATCSMCGATHMVSS